MTTNATKKYRRYMVEVNGTMYGNLKHAAEALNLNVKSLQKAAHRASAKAISNINVGGFNIHIIYS